MTDFDSFYDGEMDEQDQRILATQLRDPATARAFIAAATDEWSLQQAARGRQRLTPSINDTPTPSSRFGHQTWLLAAVGLLSLSGSLVFWFGNSEQPTPTAPASEAPIPPPAEAMQLELTGVDLPAAQTQRLAADLLAGRPAEVPAEARWRIDLPQQAGSLEVLGPSRLQREDLRHWHLSQGRLDAHIGRDGRGWRLTTPQSSCRVLGTRFQVHSDTIATRVQVAEGLVRCGPPDGTWIQEVGPGDAYTSLSHSAAWYYPFSGQGQTLLEPIDAGPILEDHRSPRKGTGGLLLDGASHCVTPVNQPMPRLVDGLQAHRGMTMAVRVEALDPLPEYLLLYELYLQVHDNGASERMGLPMQLRHRGRSPAGSHLYVAVFDEDQVHLYRDGTRYSSFTRAMPWDQLSDLAQLKLLQPSRHHDNPDDLPRLIYRDLWLFDRALSEAELSRL